MALYISTGRISDMSEVKSGTTQSGKEWQRMTLTLEMPGYQGTFFKQIFSVSGRAVDEVLKYDIDDLVEVTWSMYAKEWNGKVFNNVDLVKIAQGGKPAPKEETPAPAAPVKESLDPKSNPEDLPF